MAHQRNERASIGIVLNALHDAGNALPRRPLEVDDSVHALVAAALVAHGDAPRYAGSPRAPGEPDRQTRMRAALVQLGLVRERRVAVGGRGGLALDDARTGDVAQGAHGVMKSAWRARRCTRRGLAGGGPQRGGEARARQGHPSRERGQGGGHQSRARALVSRSRGCGGEVRLRSAGRPHRDARRQQRADQHCRLRRGVRNFSNEGSLDVLPT
ncbi:hypothetical protein FGB62_73g038 [Gracilaria domingensis]|nr:hypothetical protein FGB62_73g038 [Gracilaria domingensis]